MDCSEQEPNLRAKFLLQSPGINICWHRDEKSKFMVGEKSGTVRIYSVESLKPLYSLSCLNNITKEIGYPFMSFDWCQFSPEVIIANTNTDIYVWNTSRTRYVPFFQGLNLFFPRFITEIKVSSLFLRTDDLF
jgi:hypothetical protein